MNNELINAINEQNECREGWKKDQSADELAEMIKIEAQELVEAIEESLLTGDVFSVVSEIGDILYLTLRLCSITGINPDDAIKIKLIRNSIKYADFLVNYSDKETAKKVWDEMGGDGGFSHAYLDYLANE